MFCIFCIVYLMYSSVFCIVYFDVLMFCIFCILLCIFKNFAKFTGKYLCRSLSYQFNSQSMGRPDKRRNSQWRCSVKKGVIKNLANFTRKNLCWSLFLIKLQQIRPATLLKLDCNTDVFL